MNGMSLSDVVAKETGIDIGIVRTVLDEAVHTINNQPKTVLVGCGVFHWNERPAREARNPRTGARIYVQPTRHLTFSATKSRVTKSVPIPDGQPAPEPNTPTE